MSSRRVNSWMAILSIFATLCVAAIVTLQVLEHMHYKAPPSVWPATPAQ